MSARGPCSTCHTQSFPSAFKPAFNADDRAGENVSKSICGFKRKRIYSVDKWNKTKTPVWVYNFAFDWQRSLKNLLKMSSRRKWSRDARRPTTSASICYNHTTEDRMFIWKKKEHHCKISVLPKKGITPTSLLIVLTVYSGVFVIVKTPL